MADEDYADLPTEEQLPVPALAVDTYRHLWRYKWPYLGQLAVWTILTWIVDKPTSLISATLTQMGFVLPVAGHNLTPWIVAEIAWLLCPTVGGGLIFLSCGCAVFFGRRPRISDGIRLPLIKRFWWAIFLFWLAEELIPACTAKALSIYFDATGTYPSWLTPFTWHVGYSLYPVAVWALIGLALPIAAFESLSRPFAEAWRRLRSSHGNMLALCLITALPVIAVKACFEYFRWNTLPLAMFVPSETGLRLLFALWTPIWDFLSLLLFLVLAVCIVHVYSRLSSDSDDVVRIFD